jgi:starch phosphorylase
MNVARMAWFSSDRTIREYAEEIWSVPVRPTPQDDRDQGVRGARG